MISNIRKVIIPGNKATIIQRSLSSNPSLSETSEAISHINNQLETGNVEEVKAEIKTQSPPMLDRDRSHNLTYAVASQDKLESINRLLYASYHPDEPITKALGLYKGPGSIPDADKRVFNSVLRNLSLFAYDKHGKVYFMFV